MNLISQSYFYMKTLSFWRKSMYSALVFFGTLMVLSVGYAVLSSGLSNADKVGSGSGLTSASWNKIVDGILELDNRTANIFSSGGNVGIGTTSPQIIGSTYKTLEVNGTDGSYLLLKRTSATGGTAELAFDGNAGYLSTKTNHPLIIRTNDVERMRIDTAGNIGIGNTNPEAKLDINGNMNVNGNIHSNNFSKIIASYSYTQAGAYTWSTIIENAKSAGYMSNGVYDVIIRSSNGTWFSSWRATLAVSD